MNLFIKNRKDQNIYVVVEEVKNSKGLVFMMHGAGGNTKKTILQFCKKIFLKNNISCVLFDTTTTFGESDGNYEDSTITNYFKDLDDVISWAKKQSFYKEPYYLVGHSLGGITIILRAIKKPKEVKTIFPIAPIVSGELFLNYKFGDEKLKKWKEQGFLEWYSKSSERIKKLNYTYVKDAKKYDLLAIAHKIKTPTHLFVGDKDVSTPPKHIKLLFDKLTCKKTFDVIKDMPHAPKTETGLEIFKEKLSEYISDSKEVLVK